MQIRTLTLTGILLLTAVTTAPTPALGQGGGIQAGDVLVTVGNQGLRGVVKVDPLTGAQTVLTSGGLLGDPTDLTVGPDGMVYVVDADTSGASGGAPQVVRVDPDTGAQTVLTSGGELLSPSAIAVGEDGTLYVADVSGLAANNGGLVAVDPVTGAQTVVLVASQQSTPHHLGVDPSGNLLFVRTGLLGSPLFRINLNFGFVQQLADDVGRAEGLDVGPDGGIFVGDRGAGFGGTAQILSVDPVTGVPTAVSTGGMLTGLRGLATPDDATGFVVTASSVVRVDLSTGAQELLSTGLSDPTGVHVAPELAECFLVIGSEPGAESFDAGGHEWNTQLGGLRAAFPVTMVDMPHFPLPPLPPFAQHTPVGQSPTQHLRARYYAQVVMWNPTVFPGNPEQWTQALEISLWHDGRVTSRALGTRDGMEIELEVWTESDGSRWARFPFTIDGL